MPAANPYTSFTLADPRTWPADVIAFLEQKKSALDGWKEAPLKSRGVTYAGILEEFSTVLAPYYLIGLHGTRLTDTEIEAIRQHGMGMPDLALLTARLQALKREGIAWANELVPDPYENTPYAPGDLWFFFDLPSVAGEAGLADLFRFWGGETFYRANDYDPRLRLVGAPCLVEAAIAIPTLGHEPGRYLFDVYLGNRSSPLLAEQALASTTDAPLAPNQIRRLIRLSDDDFQSLTGCDKWGPNWLNA